MNIRCAGLRRPLNELIDQLDYRRFTRQLFQLLHVIDKLLRRLDTIQRLTRILRIIVEMSQGRFDIRRNSQAGNDLFAAE